MLNRESVGAGSARLELTWPPFVFQNVNRHLLQEVLNPCGIPVRLEVEAPVRRPAHRDHR